jgi:hypothetical protein
MPKMKGAQWMPVKKPLIFLGQSNSEILEIYMQLYLQIYYKNVPLIEKE